MLGFIIGFSFLVFSPKSAPSSTFVKSSPTIPRSPDFTFAATRKTIAISESIAYIKDDDVLEHSGQKYFDDGKIYQVGFLSRIPALVCLMQLVDQKKVSLNSPVNSYLKGIQISSPFIKTSRQLLVKDLLDEKSGYSLYKFPGDLPGTKELSTLQLLKAQKMDFAPGTKQASSAVNELIIQKLLEDVLKQSYPDIVLKRVFKPLGLKHSFFNRQIPDALRNEVMPGEKPRLIYPELAAQGLWSSANDIATMISALIKSSRDESKLLSVKSANLLFKAVDGDVTYGFHRDSLGKGYRVYLGGQTSGYSCKVEFIPEDGDGVVVLTNSDMGWSLIDKSIEDGFTALTCLKVGEQAGSFEPLHVSGEYKGQDICPICETPMLPIALLWVQRDSDENIIAIAKALQDSVVKSGTSHQKAYIIFSNVDGEFAKNKDRATLLAKKADTPDVSFVIIKNPLDESLRNYRIPRDSENVLYLVNKLIVKTSIRDFRINEGSASGLADQITSART